MKYCVFSVFDPIASQKFEKIDILSWNKHVFAKVDVVSTGAVL